MIRDGTNYRLKQISGGRSARRWKASMSSFNSSGGHLTIAINTNDSFYFTVLNDAGLST